MDGWMMDVQMHEWMNVQGDDLMDRRMDEGMDSRTDAHADREGEGWKYGWIDGSTECMPGWTDGIF